MINHVQKNRVFFLCILFILTVTVGCTARKKTVTAADTGNDSSQIPLEQRTEDILARMTLDEKIGQMTQLERNTVHQGTAASFHEGSVLSGGGSTPVNNTPAGWRNMIKQMQEDALSVSPRIPVLYGNDSVHGQNNLINATIFPHEIGLGAAGDPDLVYRIGKASAEETAACGVTWTFAPCLAVLRDPRWGRTYESYGEDTAKVTELSSSFIRGFQSVPGMLATAKHYLGDGGTAFDSSLTDNYLLDQGDTQCSESYLRETYLPPYKAAVDSGVRIVMASFSSWNGEKMHSSKYLLTDVLKNELGFTGFIVSDWAGIDQVDADYEQAVVKSINAGIDMNMVPYNGERFQSAVKKAVKSGAISQARIDDAVRRILRVKIESGLLEHPYTDESYVKTVRSPEHLALAREAAAKSLVVLKNKDSILPLKKDTALYLCGSGADDIGHQCGGWTLSWQGVTGNVTAGTTVRAALKEKYPDMIYDADGKFSTADSNAVCIVVVSEPPYAEGVGDSKTLALPDSDIRAATRAEKAFSKVVLVVISGRPVILGDMEKKAAAVAAAWLPGSEGGYGIADILTGAVTPSAKLPVDWPERVEQLPYDNFISGKEKPLYPAGYGLSW